MNVREYNGWTNYETWAVNLWLTNDKGSDALCREQAQECFEQASDKQVFSLTKSDRARDVLADLLRDEHNETIPEEVNGSVYADLIGAALSEVNWSEIANALLEDVEGYEVQS